MGGLGEGGLGAGFLFIWFGGSIQRWHSCIEFIKMQEPGELSEIAK